MYTVCHTSLRVLVHTAPVHIALERITAQPNFENCAKCLYNTNGACLKCPYQEDIVESVRGKILSLSFCDVLVALFDCKREKTLGYLPEIIPISVGEITRAVLSTSYHKLSELCDRTSDKLKRTILHTMEGASCVNQEEDKVVGKSGLDSADVLRDAACLHGKAVSKDTSLETDNKHLSNRQEQFSSIKVPAVQEMSVRWMFDVGSWCPSEGEWILALSGVQPEECTRIRRFAFRRDARASLAGRLLARLFVSRALSIPWDAVRLERDTRGKPTVREGLTDAKISFSISHAGKWAVLAGEAGYGSLVADTVGVDTVEEKHRDATHLLRIMKRNLSTIEQVSIENAGKDGPAVFFRLWALKESYLKATGEGIGGGPELSDLSFSFCCNRLPNASGCVEVRTTLEVGGRPLPRGWHFEESRIDASHIVAVAVSGSEDNCRKMKAAPPVFEEIFWNEFQSVLEPVTHHEPSFYLDYFNKPESPAYLQNTLKR